MEDFLMATLSETIQDIVDKIDTQIADIDNMISGFDELIPEIDEKITAIEDGLCEISKNELVTYINETKIPALEGLYGGETPYSLSQGENFGTIDQSDGGITDWQVIDNEGNLVYKYDGLNWDADSFITEKIEDFSIGNDFLTNPTGTAETGFLELKEYSISSRANLESDIEFLNSRKTVLSKYI
jgi:hypothetical protein